MITVNCFAFHASIHVRVGYPRRDFQLPILGASSAQQSWDRSWDFRRHRLWILLQKKTWKQKQKNMILEHMTQEFNIHQHAYSDFFGKISSSDFTVPSAIQSVSSTSYIISNIRNTKSWVPIIAIAIGPSFCCWCITIFRCTLFDLADRTTVLGLNLFALCCLC